MITFHWHTEPGLLVSLLFLGWLYCIFTGPLREKIITGLEWPKREVGIFLAGLALAYITVGSPLDQIGEQFLFSAHMLQHELLIYVLPLFAFFGTPAWLLDRILKPALVTKIARFLCKPLVAGFIFTACFSIWHVPALYEAALKSKPIHILEHVTMFASAYLMWWPIVSNSSIVPPSSYAVRMIYVFVLMVAQLPLFGFLCFSSDVLYPSYEFAPRLAFFDISPIQDQILGGVIMKVTNMIVSLAIFGISFYKWAQKSERNQRPTTV